MNNLVLSLEEQLLLLNASIDVDEKTVEKTLTLLDRPLDWNHITKLAYNHGVAPLLYSNLSKIGVDSVLPGELKALYYITASRNNSLMIETSKVLKAFNNANIRSIILKGIHLTKIIYKNLALRPVADIDILVSKSDLPNVIDILAEFGYVLPEHHLPIEVFTKYHFHLTFMSKENNHAIFEIHWDLRDSFKYSPTDISGIWNSAQEVELSGVKTMTMAQEDLLIYLCQHLDRHGYMNRFICRRQDSYNFIFSRQSMDRLIWFVDIFEMLNKYGDSINWNRVIEKTEKWDKDGSVTSSLYITDHLYDMKLSRNIFDALNPPKINFLEAVMYQFITRRASCRNWNRDHILKFYESKIIGTYTKFPFHPIRLLEINWRVLILVIQFPLDLFYYLFRKVLLRWKYG